MRRHFTHWFVLICLALSSSFLARPGFAQVAANALEQMSIEIWPDYDQPMVLVLLTGVLPAGTTLPATVTLPLPAGAAINAVARITSDGSLIDDVQYTTANQSLTLTTPETNFRVEYYLPYQANGLQRTFKLTWLADMPIAQLALRVQQPTSALTMQTIPPAEIIGEGNDGLRYHNLPAQPLPAGQPFTIEVSYTMGSEQLTAQTTNQADITTTTDQPITTNQPVDWPVLSAIAGGLLLLAGLAWQILAAQPKSARVVRPRPERVVKPPLVQHQTQSVKFCHQCGTATRPGDRFCRNCGQPLKSNNPTT